MLRGDTLYLTPLDPVNAEIARAWMNDPEINRYLLTGQVPITREQEVSFYERTAARYAAGTGYVFEIHVAADGRYVGNCGLDKVDLRHRSAEIGILIGEPDAQNSGYGRDAIRTLLRFGFDTLGLHRIAIKCQADNDRGMHLYPKLGFREVGRERDATYTFGKWVDEAVFDMLDSEWRARDTR